MESYNNILSRMQTSFKNLAGFDPDDASDIGIRLKVLAGEIFSLYSEFNYIKNQIFIQTSTGENLDNHALQRGLNRKEALCATGVLTFSRVNALPYSLNIPIGTICCTSNTEKGIRFETTEDAILPPGATSVNVKAKSLEGGKDKNVAANTITVMVSPPAGITYVNNESRFSGATDEESDDDLRKRIVESYKNVSNGTNIAFYKSVALSHSGVYSAGVIPKARGTGTVDIYIAGRGELVSEEILNEVQADISKQREVNVDALVNNPELVPVSTILYIDVKENYVFDDVKNECITAIENYYNSLKIGDSFLVAAIADCIYHIEGVKNYYIPSISTYDRTATESQLIIVGNINIYRQQGVE